MTKHLIYALMRQRDRVQIRPTFASVQASMATTGCMKLKPLKMHRPSDTSNQAVTGLGAAGAADAARGAGAADAAGAAKGEVRAVRAVGAMVGATPDATVGATVGAAVGGRIDVTMAGAMKLSHSIVAAVMPQTDVVAVPIMMQKQEQRNN